MDFGSNGFTNALALLSLIVSGILSFFYFRDRKHAKFTIENEYVTQLLAWYSEVIEVLIQLKCTVDAPSDMTRSTSLSKLSSLIEKGRFFFPNIDKGNDFGKDKPPAYRGYRNLALDFLVASYNLHTCSEPKLHAAQAENLIRLFTSIVFEIVRPKERLEKIRSITDKYYAQDLCIEDFLKQGGGPTIHYIWQK